MYRFKRGTYHQSLLQNSIEMAKRFQNDGIKERFSSQSISLTPMVAYLFHSTAHHEKRGECAPTNKHRQTPSPPTPPEGIQFALDSLNFADQSAPETLDKLHADHKMCQGAASV
jgi:hypothetical protein